MSLTGKPTAPTSADLQFQNASGGYGESAYSAPAASPKKMPVERPCRLTLMVTEEVYNAFKVEAKLRHLTPSRFLELLVQKEVPERFK